MARSQHRWTQFEVVSTQGAETWVIVRHRSGCFKIPATASIADLLDGVRNGWDMSNSRKITGGRTRVEIDLAELKVLRHIAQVAEASMPGTRANVEHVTRRAYRYRDAEGTQGDRLADTP